MTEKQIRQKVVDTAIKYLGCKESNGSHKKIIDIYNTHKPLAVNYKVQYTDAWCATFVSAIAILCDLTNIIYTECGCGRMIELYKKHGRWEENDAYVPNVGDIIMYDWGDKSATGDNKGYPDHVGYVVSVDGKTIKVIEGNKNDRVAYRTIAVNGRYIRGYCLPDYASIAEPEEEIKEEVKEKAKEEIEVDAKDNANSSKEKLFDGKVTTDLNVREWAGVEYKTVSFSPLKKGTIITVCDVVKADNGEDWYYINHGGKFGFVSSAYVTKK